MLIFKVRRFGTMILTMLVVSVLVFSLLEINVDSVATNVLGPYSLQEQREIWLENNGYTDTAVLRSLRWIGIVMVGDFGDSVRSKVSVYEVLWPQLANTAILGVLDMFFHSPFGPNHGWLAGP